MDVHWKKALPFLGALVTGGVPAMVTAAASAIGDALGTTVAPTKDAVDKAMAAATPEQIAVLSQIDADLKVQMRSFEVQELQIEAGTTKAYLADIDSARRAHAQQTGVLRLAYGINALSYLLIAIVIVGCFLLMSGRWDVKVDAGIAAMLGSLIGASVQWVLAQSQQANSYCFGSSPSSRQANAELSAAVTGALKSPR
jgi:hypothetical protein